MVSENAIEVSMRSSEKGRNNFIELIDLFRIFFFPIEELLKQKFMRSISKISNKGNGDVEEIEEMLHDQLKRRMSTRKSLNKKESMKTINRVLSKV